MRKTRKILLAIALIVLSFAMMTIFASASSAGEVQEYSLNNGGKLQVVGNIEFTQVDNVITVTHDHACKVGYLDGEKYRILCANENDDGSYSFILPDEATDVLIVVSGDVNFDGRVTAADVARLNAHIIGKNTIDADALFAGDVDGDCNETVGDIVDSISDVLRRTPLTVQVHTYAKGICSLCQDIKYSEGLELTLNDDGTSYSVAGIGSCEDIDILISPTYNGLPVTEIEESAFEGCAVIASINIPDSVTSVGSSAFSGCTSLKSIIVDEDNLIYHADGNCLIETATQTLVAGCNESVIPNDGSVTSIGTSAFSGCDSLESVTIPDSVTSIGISAFSDCTSLKNVYYSGTETEWNAIDIHSTNAKFINIKRYYYSETAPTVEGNFWHYVDGVPTVWKQVVTDSVGLEFTLNSDNASYSVTGIGTCTDTDVIIPAVYDGKPVTGIANNAFKGCTSLTSITIPDSVTSICDYSFGGCTSLTSVTIGNGVTSIGDWSFYKCTSLTSITIPDSVTSIGNYAFYICTNLTSITIPSSVTYLGAQAFNYCTSLTSISVEKGNSVFHSSGNCIIDTQYKRLVQGCHTSVIPSDGSVTVIESGAFEGCKNLTSVTIPDTVTSIGQNAFCDCTSLESIIIPDSVTSIGDSAFFLCPSLTSVTIPDSVTSIGYNTFCGCTSLTNVTIGNSVKSIGEMAFENCTSLTSVTIPNSVTIIGFSAFSRCTSLTSINIPNSVTSIGDSAFFGCTSLTSVTIPDSVTSISDSAFVGCSSLTSVTIPGSVTSIGLAAFDFCTSLTSVTIPKSVTSIAASAFSGRTGLKLKDVYYTGTEAEWNTITIGSDNEALANANIYYYSETAPTVEGNFWHYVDGVPTVWEQIHIHTIVIDVAVAPTCTATGLTEGKHCSVCNEVIVAQTVAPAKGHSAGANATCSKEQTCIVCGDIINAALGHTEVIDAAVAPTCTATGLTEGKHCSVCNTVIVAQNVVPAKGHTEVIDAAVAPTCTATGLTEGKHCAVCNTVIVAQSVVAAKGHTEVIDAAVAPTCTTIGWTERKHCSVCNVTLVSKVFLPSLGHTVVVDKAVAPTCTAAGKTEGKHCSVCNTVIVEQSVVPANGHSMLNGTCAVCGYSGAIVASGTCGSNYNKWVLYETGLFTVSGSGTMGSYGSLESIPWANYKDKIKFVNISEGITGVTSYAFCGCTDLTNVILSEGITSIGRFAFSGCTSLETFSIPSGVAIIGRCVFQNCNISSITIPKGVTTIQEMAFIGCALEELFISSSVTSIEKSAFEDCDSLMRISVDTDNTVYHSRDNCIIETSTKTLVVGCKTSIIPNDGSVTILGNSAFIGCASLESIIIPSSIVEIGPSAFAHCTSLNNVIIPAGVKYIRSRAFEYCTSLTNINISDSVVAIGTHAFNNCTSLVSITIPDGIKTINGYTFLNCTSLASITIPDSVKDFYGYAFNGCNALKDIYYTGTKAEWNAMSFYGDLNLENITIHYNS